MFDIKKTPDETALAYIWRVGCAKDSGLIDSTWSELAKILNEELEENITESAYRKKYAIMKKAHDEIFSKSVSNELESEKHLIELRHELEKERVKVRDERNELRRILREKAREESFAEQINRIISEYDYAPIPDDREVITYFSPGNSDLLIPMMDLHYGIDIDNYFNQYNDGMFVKRKQKYLHNIRKISELHHSQNAYVVLSELISGAIHNTLRIESNQNVIEQFLNICNHLTFFLIELSKMFENVNVYVAPGNHSRLFQNKDDVRKGENMDHLAIPFLSAKLQNYDNIHFFENRCVDESVAIMDIRGKQVIAVHGDKDSPDTVVRSLAEFAGIIPDIVLMGHRHLNKFEDKNGKSVIIQTGCFSGIDNYCLDKRLMGKPSQMVTVINDHGVKCLYPVIL